MARRTLQVIILGCLIASGALPGAPAPAAGRTLAVPDTYPTIQAAMDAAARGDIILVGCGVYREHDIRVTPGVTLWSGTLQPDCVVIDAGRRGRIFLFSACDTTTSVVGFTLRNGHSDQDGGAILCRDSSPRLTRLRIEASRARHGGGLASVGQGAARLVDCVIVGNTADLLGGGVFWDSGGDGRLEQCTFVNNTAVAGGALAGRRSGRLHLDRVVFSGNEAAGSGGAVWLGGGTATFDRCLLVGNHGGLAGGAVAVRGAAATLIGCTVADNAAETQGGGLLAQAAALDLRRTIVAFNDGDAVSGGLGSDLSLIACNVFGHGHGDWAGPLVDLAGRDGNFSLDPVFCSRQAGGYYLRRGSPCLPGGRGGATGEVIGARPLGCD